MTPEDLARLYARSMSGSRAWTTSEFSDLLAHPSVFLSQAEGAFALGRVVAGEAELLTIVVDPKHHRQGIGRTLLADFVDAARARGATTAFLEVAADNKPAIALYQGNGWKIVGNRPDYYALQTGKRVDALVMSCTID